MGIAITEESFHEYEDQYEVNGLFYFKLDHYKPEVSGYYECIYQKDSSTDRMVKSGYFTPHIYYDINNDGWYLEHKPEALREYKISSKLIRGWRDYKTEKYFESDANLVG